MLPKLLLMNNETALLIHMLSMTFLAALLLAMWGWDVLSIYICLLSFAQSVYSLCICVCTPSIFSTSVMCNIFNHQLLQLQLLKETTVSNVCITVFSDWVWSLWSWCDSGIRSSKQPNAAVPLGIVNASNYCLFVCMLFFIEWNIRYFDFPKWDVQTVFGKVV